jgi:hypothetical protein
LFLSRADAGHSLHRQPPAIGARVRVCQPANTATKSLPTAAPAAIISIGGKPFDSHHVLCYPPIRLTPACIELAPSLCPQFVMRAGLRASVPAPWWRAQQLVRCVAFYAGRARHICRELLSSRSMKHLANLLGQHVVMPAFFLAVTGSASSFPLPLRCLRHDACPT